MAPVPGGLGFDVFPVPRPTWSRPRSWWLTRFWQTPGSNLQFLWEVDFPSVWNKYHRRTSSSHSSGTTPWFQRHPASLCPSRYGCCGSSCSFLLASRRKTNRPSTWLRTELSVSLVSAADVLHFLSSTFLSRASDVSLMNSYFLASSLTASLSVLR